MIMSSHEWQARPRTVVGLMSGTSLDGVDAAIIEVDGGVPFRTLAVRAFYTRAYHDRERARLTDLMRPDVPLPELVQANVWLGELFADAALQAITQAGMTPRQVDAIASHGQTVWHLPPSDDTPGATMQIGEPCVIAERTGLLTVADFRPRDMAAGGHGAPLVPFADYHLFSSPDSAVAVQNIGGIGNVTWLKRGGTLDDVIAFDTGPGNMVIDALVQRYGRGTFDRDGAMAAAGRVDETLLASWLSHPYFSSPPPKTTGRELFGAQYVVEVVQHAESRRLSPEDTVATATALTAESIARAYSTWLPGVDVVILGGGGSYNLTLRRMLAERLPGVAVKMHEDYGISSEAKEAIAFALLGYATLCGVPANVPAATGARHPVVLGTIIPGHVGP